MNDKFLRPGNDGEFDASANIWVKGIVFTTWADISRPTRKPGYRISVGCKQRASALLLRSTRVPGVRFLGQKRVH